MFTYPITFYPISFYGVMEGRSIIVNVCLTALCQYIPSRTDSSRLTTTNKSFVLGESSKNSHTKPTLKINDFIRNECKISVLKNASISNEKMDVEGVLGRY